jgi:RNA polymerase sigma-70 factor (ECF subfamily)
MEPLGIMSTAAVIRLKSLQLVPMEPQLENTVSRLSSSPYVEQSIVSILERVAAQDPTSFHECVEKYGGLVWSLARRFTPNHADAEDATQEIFLDLWQKADRWDRSKSSEVTFVTMLARRKLIDRFRKSNRSIEWSSLGDDSSADLPSSSIASSVEILDESEKATRCLGKLGEKQREVIRLSIHQGLSHSKISERLEMPIGTVKTYARRSLLELRECMERFERMVGAS